MRMGMAAIRSMLDLLEALPRLGYSAATANQIRPQIKKCATVYNTDLSRIPAGATEFEEKWGRGRVAALDLGFRDEAEFIEWRKRVRGALNRATRPAAEARAAIGSDWIALLALVKCQGGVGRQLPPDLDLSLALLARLASPEGVTPQLVSGLWAARAIEGLRGSAGAGTARMLPPHSPMPARRALRGFRAATRPGP